MFAFVKQERFSEQDSQIFTESLWLEKASKVFKSKLGTNPTIPTKCEVDIDPHPEGKAENHTEVRGSGRNFNWGWSLQSPEQDPGEAFHMGRTQSCGQGSTWSQWKP